VNAARNSFTRLFDRLGRYYENVSIRPDVGFRERNSLVRLLGRGLSKVLRTGSETAPSSPQVSVLLLRTFLHCGHFLAFLFRICRISATK
jgi:hypothetical protein